MIPLTTTAPSTAIGTLRLGSLVSSASGAAASNPPKASTARLNATSTSLPAPPDGQPNGVALSPSAPPRARIVTLLASSSTTSNTYSATVTRMPNLSPTTTGATTRMPYRIVTIWVKPQKCTEENTSPVM